MGVHGHAVFVLCCTSSIYIVVGSGRRLPFVLAGFGFRAIFNTGSFELSMDGWKCFDIFSGIVYKI